MRDVTIQPRPSSRLTTTGLVAIAMILVVVAGGCQSVRPDPTSISTPGASADAAATTPGTSLSQESSTTAPASPLATKRPPSAPVASLSTIGLAVDAAALTVTDRLRVRSEPGVGPGSAKFEPLLASGTLLFVAAGPVTADGYAWYQVMPFDGIAPAGWVASAAHDGTPWVSAASLTCPAPPLDAEAVLNLSSFGGLVCYGGREIKLVGDISCEVADVDRVFAGPDWLRSNHYCEFDLGGQTIEFLDGGIGGLGLPTHGRGLVTGHFDDPQATTCSWAVEPPAPDPALVVVSCRAMFVATDLTGGP